MATHKDIYIMIGLPGAGKSTWTQNTIKNSHLRPNQYKILSRDIIRAELGFTQNADEKALLSRQDEEKVSREFNRQLYYTINDDKIEAIFIDNLNLKARYRRNQVNDIVRMDFFSDLYYVVFDTPLETCIKRRDDQIDPIVMKQLYQTFKSNLPLIKEEASDYNISLIWEFGKDSSHLYY